MRKIPPHAVKVFEGIISDVYHWEQEQFDGTLRTFEGIRQLSNVIIVPIVGDKIYIHKEEQPGDPTVVTLPAGRFDRGESDPILVAGRELMEETGYVAEEAELFRSVPNVMGNVEWTSHIVIARGCRKVAEPDEDPGERIHETMLVTFEEMLALSEDPDFRGGALKNDWIRAKGDPVFREDFRKRLFRV